MPLSLIAVMVVGTLVGLPLIMLKLSIFTSSAVMVVGTLVGLPLLNNGIERRGNNCAVMVVGTLVGLPRKHRATKTNKTNKTNKQNHD